MHVGGGPRHLPQRRRGERLPVRRLLRDQEPPGVLAERPVVRKSRHLADEPRGRQHPRILLLLRVLRDAEVVEPLVGQVRAVMARRATGLAEEQRQPGALPRRERPRLPAQVTVQRRVAGEKGPLEGGDRHRHALPGDLSPEDGSKRLHVGRDRFQHLLEIVEVPVHLEGAHHREEGLILERGGAPVPEEGLPPGDVHEPRGVPPVPRGGVGKGDRKRVGEPAPGVVAGGAAHRPVPRQAPVEEQLFPEFDLLRGGRVLRRGRRGRKRGERGGCGGLRGEQRGRNDPSSCEERR